MHCEIEYYHFDQLHPLSTDRESLPAAVSRGAILKALDTNRVMIVCGATGCGKSTQIPQYNTCTNTCKY